MKVHIVKLKDIQFCYTQQRKTVISHILYVKLEVLNVAWKKDLNIDWLSKLILIIVFSVNLNNKDLLSITAWQSWKACEKYISTNAQNRSLFIIILTKTTE